MLPNVKLNEQLAILDYLAPASVAASTVTTPSWIYVGNLHVLQAIIETGVLGASATLDAKIRQATDSSGTGAKDVTGKAITQIVKATGDNKIATIDFRAQDLDTTNNFDYVQVSLTVGTAASIIGAKLLGLARFEPVNASGASLNVTTVVQQV